MNSAIRPIETLYRGCRFRSRLEARWAVFFQTLGVRWEYEPQGFCLPSGKRYLPDFRIWLADGPLWAEVKPSDVSPDPFGDFIEAIGKSENRPGLRGAVLREIPDPQELGAWGGSCPDNEIYIFTGIDDPTCGSIGWDNGHMFCICPKCGGVGFEFTGRSERINCKCPKPRDETHTYDDPRIVKAATAARSARFEHGEVP